MEVFKATETISHTTIELTSRDIIDLLIKDGRLDKDSHNRVQFTIPGGGDYSGMTIEIDKTTPIVVTSNKSQVIECEKKEE